ncbi:MAG: hypothetical protein C7B46_15915 [Sulfobacillus benefaciens]|uniref:Uncharacterized protein n=1 Tax=Sulfobacillus benefaciens TaxID=453960 RepID=A0A2T2XC66_9FIRM|nr:MAG: hypothetical protein C7B46_15915 [Sulfobacillus benefaciens]
MSSQRDFFVQLTENRSQQSLGRISTTDNRALGLFGLITALMAGLWAIDLAPSMHRSNLHTFEHARVITTLLILGIAFFTSGYSLLLTVQYDSPDVEQFYRKYYSQRDSAIGLNI